MAVTVQVPVQVLRAAKVGWDDAADLLDGSWRRLETTSVNGLSTEVAAAAQRFQETWAEEIRRRALDARRHSEAFVEVAGEFSYSDLAAAEEARALLGWVHRDAPIGEA